MATWWAATALTGHGLQRGVRLTSADGVLSGVDAGRAPEPGDVRLDLVVPGFVNAHSHAFHRALRGRTHAGGGTFWTWRAAMYDLAGRLGPESYQRLATAVYAEMAVTGWTAVGEFHYLHHHPDGSPYPGHAMEAALAAAARAAGLRLVLLDTLYLTGGVDAPLAPGQVRFSDGTAAAWLERWHALTQALGADPGGADGRVRVGAALHSVRAVGPDDVAAAVEGLPADAPLHVHLSEQPAENADCLARYGLTPTQVLHRAGALGPRLSVVHATHLGDDDVALLGDAGVTAVLCPTTEADLGDGVGPARRLADAGARIALGSDQHAVVDPLLELRALEAGERLAAQQRGRFTPGELLAAATTAGARSLGLAGDGLVPGAPCDLVELDTGSVRTAGAAPEQVVLAATAADVRRVVVAGRVVAEDGRLTAPGGGEPVDPGRLLREALDDLRGAAA